MNYETSAFVLQLPCHCGMISKTNLQMEYIDCSSPNAIHHLLGVAILVHAQEHNCYTGVQPNQ
jgi:hypothetical protein